MKRSLPENGETVTQTVLAVPVLLTILMLALQVTVNYHAGNVANTSAVQAARAVAAVGATSERASQVAESVVEQLDAQLAGTVLVEQREGRVIVKVNVRTPQIFPGLGGSVTREVEIPKERFISELERISSVR
jgi:anti-sigma factor RsiW